MRVAQRPDIMFDDGDARAALNAACARALADATHDHRSVASEVCATIIRAMKNANIEVTDALPFGSTMSGFAVEADCDVDVCVLCGTHPSDFKLPSDRRFSATAKRASTALRRMAGVSTVVAILGARVPIVKFKVRCTGGRDVPVDLCFNALNGVRNTELLRRLDLVAAKSPPPATLAPPPMALPGPPEPSAFVSLLRPTSVWAR